MTDEVKASAAADESTAPAAKVDAPARVEAPEPTREDRVNALLSGYEHGMNSNAPRTDAEFAELKALLKG